MPDEVAVYDGTFRLEDVPADVRAVRDEVLALALEAPVATSAAA
jgi:hypothetical protein